jgi:hypothetical protein
MVKRNLSIPFKFIVYTDHPSQTFAHEKSDFRNNQIPDYQTRKLPFTNYDGWWNKLTLFSPEADLKGTCLYFDLDIDINDNIDFLVNEFDNLTLVNSSPWQQQSLKEPLKFRVTQNTLVNSSIMRWSDERKILEKFLKHRDLYLRLYSGIDRFIYNEDIKYKYFMGDSISSWKENIRNNTIMLYNGKYV